MRNWEDEAPILSKTTSKTSKKPSTESVQDSAALSLGSLRTKKDAAMASKSPDEMPINLQLMEKKENANGPEHVADEASSVHVAFDQAATKKLIQKLDLHLIPFLAFIYLLCFLDRTNVGNARLVGLEKDLHMKGLDYNAALAIFFPFYVAAEIPSNMIMKRWRPSLWFTVIMVAWGLIMTCMGLVHNYSGLLACRVFLGIAEGGLFPGITYFISMWYRRDECGLRIALFFSAATIAGAFGGLLARAISIMDGVGGKAGWAWIFILEGLLTLVVGSFSFLAINDYPATAKFLTPGEKIEVQRRLVEDSGLNEDFNMKYFWDALKDWKIWIHMILTIGLFTPLYSVALFLPTIVKGMGYSANAAQLMTVPPYVIACFFTITGSFFADRFGQRGVFLLGFEALAVVGLLMLVTTGKPHIQYGGTVLAASGIYPLVPLICAWTSNNLGGSLKRGVGIAMQVGFGNLGGAIAGFVYLSKDSPRFIQGHCILLGLIFMSFCLTIFMTVYYRRENARRAALSVNDLSEQELALEREKGDRALFFKYTV